MLSSGFLKLVRLQLCFVEAGKKKKKREADEMKKQTLHAHEENNWTLYAW